MGIKGSCIVCSHPERERINVEIMEGRSILSIQKRLALTDRPVRHQVITRHANQHVRGVERVARRRLDVVRGGGGPGKPGHATKVPPDFATAVREKAMELMEAGALEITTRDGLAAQGLIDRRTEKEKDREFVLNLARLLSGAGRGAPAEIIDGDYLVMDEDDGDLALLAPVSVREP